MPLDRIGPANAAIRERDTYVDFLRVVSVLCVVLGHWFSARVWWDVGRVGVGNILAAIPELWPGTWILMTVPVLFFVGGFSNFVLLTRCYGSGQRASGFFARRVRRLLIPTMVFGGSWVSVEILLHLLGLGGSDLIRGVSVRGDGPFGPLWFMGVYVGIIALCPITLALHTRFGVFVPAALVAGCIVIDILRFVLHVPLIGWLNLAFAWLVPHQFGYFYADGSLDTQSRRAPLQLCLVGFVTLVAVTSIGIYPRTIGAVSRAEISNMAPPTLVIIALSFWQVGLVLLCRSWILGILRRRRVAAVVDRLKPVTLSLYLWHMTALLVMLLLVAPIGLSKAGQSLTHWWVQRPFWLALGVPVLVGITRMVAWAERAR